MPNVAYVKPEIIKWARVLHQLTRAELADRAGVHQNQIAKWEDGKTKPTFTQATSLAKALNIPFGYLFLSEPPTLEEPLPDLRTRRNKPLKRLSVEAREVLYGVLDIQDWYREYRLEYDQQRLPFVARFSIADDPKTVATDIRNTLLINDELREGARTLRSYLTALCERAESKGILVMESGVVGNDNRRSLSPDEFQGFVAVDDFAPIVFVNSRDYIAARIFTLAHELAHIWVGKSGILNPDQATIPKLINDTESFCNVVSTETLVPESEFIPMFNSVSGALHDLARYFHVSRLVVLRRAFELNQIGRDEFFGRLQALGQGSTTKKFGRGKPNYYFNVARRHSPMFTDTVIKDVRIGGTLVRDAAHLLHMGTSAFSRMAEGGEY